MNTWLRNIVSRSGTAGRGLMHLNGFEWFLGAEAVDRSGSSFCSGSRFPSPKRRVLLQQDPKREAGHRSVCLGSLADRGVVECGEHGALSPISNILFMIGWTCLVLLQLYHRALEAHPACDVSLAVWTRNHGIFSIEAVDTS